MAYTTIPNLTTSDPKSGEIENGSGYYKPGHTFFYWQDIEKVLEQSIGAPIANLKLVNIKFERKDGGKNHERYEVTGLALRKTDEEIEALGGSFNNEVEGKSKWHNKVALAWPVYYREGSTQTLLDSDNPKQEYNGQPFEGHDEYLPGFEIHKE